MLLLISKLSLKIKTPLFTEYKIVYIYFRYYAKKITASKIVNYTYLEYFFLISHNFLFNILSYFLECAPLNIMLNCLFLTQMYYYLPRRE